MKILNTNLSKYNTPSWAVSIISIFFAMLSLISVVNRSDNITQELTHTSTLSIDSLLQGNLAKFQEQNSKNNKIKDYDTYLRIENVDSKHISYSYNSDRDASFTQGIYLMKYLGESPSIDKIKKLTINGVEFSIEDIKNEYKFKEFTQKEIIDAQHKSKDSFKTINIELK